MTQPRLSFIDWMKSLGILLIVIGHVSAFTNRLVPPIYQKQLGVAFFLFTTGYTLAREVRPGRVVLFNRLFEIFLFGIACALMLSVINYALSSNLAESNYLPFLLGINVAFDNFPANPTTWFIGTYIHFLLIWAIALRGLRIRPWMLALSVVAEVISRAALAHVAGLFVAYMAVPNWATVFLLGLYRGQQNPEAEPTTWPVPYLAGLVVFALAWPALVGPMVAEYTFPFMRLAIDPPLVSSIVQSILVSFLYLFYTVLTYQITRRLPDWAGPRFLARNTLFIFIVHMPVFYALSGPLIRLIDSRGLRAAVQFVVCFLLLAVLSELLHRAIRPSHLRDSLRRLCFGEDSSVGPPQAPKRDSTLRDTVLVITPTPEGDSYSEHA